MLYLNEITNAAEVIQREDDLVVFPQEFLIVGKKIDITVKLWLVFIIKVSVFKKNYNYLSSQDLNTLSDDISGALTHGYGICSGFRPPKAENI